jgi:hypothetical protein
MELQDKILNLLNENNLELWGTKEHLSHLYHELDVLALKNQWCPEMVKISVEIHQVELDIELMENKFKKEKLQLINSLIELNK